MRRLKIYPLSIFIVVSLSFFLASCLGTSIGHQQAKWDHRSDVAQYKGANWSNEVKRVSGVSVEEAKRIAEADPSITYFFYMKAPRMYLEGKAGPDGWADKGVFLGGDAVFFSGDPWYGSAPGFADSYEKKMLE